MDVVHTRGQSTTARGPGASERTGKAKQSTQSAMDMDHDDSNDTGNVSTASDSPNTSNLISTEKGSQTHSRDDSKSPASNGKSIKNHNKYIPPVKSREHNTRSKNGFRREVQLRDESADKESVETDATKLLLDEAADQLARIDDHTYHNLQMRDADEVLSRLVLPMSFPWTHKISGYRVISRDIDELEGVINCEEEFPGEERMGELGETKTYTMPQHHLLSARRSSHDPGIIHLTRIRLPWSVDPSIEPTRTSGVDLEELDRETSLGFLGLTQRRKRRRADVIEENTERLTVSLCFGGTSSRSTLRPTDSALGEPFVLRAKLPSEIAGGRRMDASRALEESTLLGSYDYRHGLPRLVESTKRVRTGRIRTIWSSKQSVSQRPVHKSLLTGRTLEIGQQRRPSDVLVFIRLNGSLLTLDKNHTKNSIDNNEGDDWAGSWYSNHVVDAALQIAEENEINATPRENLLCSFDTTAYFESIRKRNSSASQFLKRIHAPYYVEVVEKDRLWLSIRPPLLLSTPCEDGVFQVVCSQPGELKGIQYTDNVSVGLPTSKSYPWATAIFLDAMAKRHQACCICWSGPENDDENHLVICTSCQLRVHPKCCFDKEMFDPNWICDSCLDYQERASVLPASLTPLNVRWARKCGLCDQFGSAVALHRPPGTCEGHRSWVHVQCRKWECANSFEEGTCVLCSKNSEYLVRCAATGCSVKFHPMCGIIASHAAAAGRASDHTFLGGAIESEEDQDIFLATQYCQEVASISYGNKKVKTRSIPVAYCGLHNPQRAPDRYGLLPAAVYFNDAVRLPLQRMHEGVRS